MKRIFLFLVAAIAIAITIFNFWKQEPAVEEMNVEDYDDFEESWKQREEYMFDLFARFSRYTKEMKIDSLATFFQYPIRRQYPTRDIMNQKEFIERYEEIFDKEFRNKIINNPDDWGLVNWRGYMYDLGDLWIEDGDNEIYAVNVYSKLGEERLIQDIKSERSHLHESIKVHATDPICSFVTKNGEWYGRIDNISPVDNINAQISLYKSTTPIDCAPDFMVLGREEVQGTACNLFYTFQGGSFSFEVNNPRIYESGRYPYTLKIIHNYGETYEGTFDVDWVYWEDIIDLYL